jgi:ferredoxin
VVIKTDYDEYDEECIQEAVESCPSEAIATE